MQLAVELSLAELPDNLGQLAHRMTNWAQAARLTRALGHPAEAG